ncbi:MAG: cryptochrome/photolyase family protein [Nevskiaceae bacterium]|nr:MAG: cryptochrome/photolyase family protein [Nevskiaceae bacterium]
MAETPIRNLVLVLGDQLDADASAFDGFDPASDAVWMAEVDEESTHVWSSKIRTALFLSAMRHFAEDLRARGFRVHYRALTAASPVSTLADALAETLRTLQPQGVVMTAPGDWRVLHGLQRTVRGAGLTLDLRDDRHFYCTVRDFSRHLQGRKTLRLEYFYRELRRRHSVLMDGDEPVGGRWNYDSENREPLTAEVVATVPAPVRFEIDAITREVLSLVEQRFAAHPGVLDAFSWPVTRAQALQALDAFIAQRLPQFGRYQDAMWPGQAWLFHSHLSAALNLKLLNPREVVDAAERAYRDGRAGLASVEGFIRQILGWREYVRGIYWTQMPAYLERNALEATQPLPAFYWTGDTEMACLRDALQQTLNLGYAHHIQRLMVTGLYALLLGVDPKAIHAWYLAVYVDAVEWVELPNTLGMSQFADGGLMASKPYVASGRYIDRMSPYCKQCRYDPQKSTGPKACPVTVLYWDFLMRHEPRLARNPRMGMQLRNLQRLDEATRDAIRAGAEAIRQPEG